MANEEFDVAIATCRPTPGVDVDEDEARLMGALAEAGIGARLLAWDDPEAPFDRARLTVLRSTWNYLHRWEDFLAWANRLDNRLVNPASVVRWNTHKWYLRELEEAGIAVVPAVLIPRGTGVELETLLRKKHWFRAVGKPAVGAASFATRILASSAQDAAWFSAQVAVRDMLLEPYLGAVETSGERAMVFIDGELTHAVRKERRLEGDPERHTSIEVDADERELAERAMRWIVRRLPCGSLLYGRVDVLRDDQGVPRILELELVEPSLFFADYPQALERFLAGLRTRLGWLPPLRARG